MMALMILSAVFVFIGSALLAAVASTPRGWDERQLNRAFLAAMTAHVLAMAFALVMLWRSVL